jgi:hypothetical protein
MRRKNLHRYKNRSINKVFGIILVSISSTHKQYGVFCFQPVSFIALLYCKQFKTETMHIQNLQPVQVNGSSYLNIVADKIEKLTIKVFDVQGWVAKKVTTEVEEGIQQVNLNMSDLTNGIYILNAFIGDVFIKSIRFVKQ